MVLDSKIPSGPIGEKWDRHRFESKLVNPATLVFAYTPVEDPALYTKVWDGFLKHLDKVTGKKVVFFPVQSNAA